MKQKEQYAGLDYFRVIAALLVITIHTSPLSSVDITGDFVLTRIIARIAVPFFFMTSGFFLLPDYTENKKSLWRFIKKTAIYYIFGSILYLPVNLYAGYFNKSDLLYNIFRDILLDGTFYHLWYLPAAMLGALITCFLLKKFKASNAFFITLLLYAIGLFGDSYYGAISKVYLIKSFYGVLFTVSSYTRNGIFFAPVFIMLGGIIRNHKVRRVKSCTLCFLISFALLIVEGLLLHAFNLQKHDTMYFMLLPCMFFLFQSLLFISGKGSKILRKLSMVMYIIHPFIIILLRGILKACRLKVLIDKSLIFYILVSAFTFVLSFFIVKKAKGINKKNTSNEKVQGDRAWAEINLDNLRENVKLIKGQLQEGCEIMAVVKANAYGFGDVKISNFLSGLGIKSFAIATVDEGIRLRKNGIKGNILILGYTGPHRIYDLVKYNLMQTVADLEHAKELDAFNEEISVHIKVDTGMHRLGEYYKNIEKIESIYRCKNLKICGIFSHLCTADSLQADDVEFTREQINSFYKVLRKLKEHNLKIPKAHIQSSYGILNYPEVKLSYARIGIALYGVLSAKDRTKVKLDLKPVLSLRSRVVLTRKISEGDTVGYGRQFTAMKDLHIAVISIGYADGLPRALSCGNGEVLLHGCRVPIIGRICMDQLMININDVENVKPGDIVTLIGSDGKEEITAEEVAAASHTITNELLSRLGERIERIYL